MPGDRIRSPLYADKGGGEVGGLQSAGLWRAGGLWDWRFTITGVLETEAGRDREGDE